MKCSAVQCSAVQCSSVQCSAAQRSALQCSAVQCSAVQCSAVPCRAVPCRAVPCSSVQCSASCKHHRHHHHYATKMARSTSPSHEPVSVPSLCLLVDKTSLPGGMVCRLWNRSKHSMIVLNIRHLPVARLVGSIIVVIDQQLVRGCWCGRMSRWKCGAVGHHRL